MQIRLCVQENNAILGTHIKRLEVPEIFKTERAVKHSVHLGCPGCEVKLYGLTPEQAEEYPPGQHFWLSLSPDGEPVL